jgi:hypothetical protein
MAFVEKILRGIAEGKTLQCAKGLDIMEKTFKGLKEPFEYESLIERFLENSFAKELSREEVIALKSLPCQVHAILQLFNLAIEAHDRDVIFFTYLSQHPEDIALLKTDLDAIRKAKGVKLDEPLDAAAKPGDEEVLTLVEKIKAKIAELDSFIFTAEGLKIRLTEIYGRLKEEIDIIEHIDTTKDTFPPVHRFHGQKGQSAYPKITPLDKGRVKRLIDVGNEEQLSPYLTVIKDSANIQELGERLEDANKEEDRAVSRN